MSALWTGLFHDASVRSGTSDPASLASAVGRYRIRRQSEIGATVGALVIQDRELAALDRAALDRAALDRAAATGGHEAPAGSLERDRRQDGPEAHDRQPVEVIAVNTSGAGGLLALAGRSFDRIRVVGVESALRDLDDLAGNAARVVAAAGELDEEIEVFVEIPFAPGWERAVDELEAADLRAAIRIPGERPDLAAEQLARQISTLVEADLPFKILGLPTASTAATRRRVIRDGSGGPELTSGAESRALGNPDLGNPDLGNPDHGNPDHGNPDHGNPDHGNPDHGNPDVSGGIGAASAVAALIDLLLILVAVDSLIEDATVESARAWLERGFTATAPSTADDNLAEEIAAVVDAWDAAHQQRIRRRLRSLDVMDPDRIVESLAALRGF